MEAKTFLESKQRGGERTEKYGSTGERDLLQLFL